MKFNQFLSPAAFTLLFFQGGFVWASGLQSYQLGPAGCSFEITAKKNSYVYQDGDNYSSLKEYGGQRNAGLDFNFKCTRQKRGEDYCREHWWQSLLPDDASSLKIKDVRYYDNVHSFYLSIVYSANIMAVAEPRPRLINFCLAAETTAIEGSVYVGTEKKYQVQPALAILKTIKIR